MIEDTPKETLSGTKKLLVLSDSHGDFPALAGILNWTKSNPFDAAVFLGDGLYDLERTPFSRIIQTVRGNSDYGISGRETAVLDFGGHRFFLCHGHRYSLYDDFDTLIHAARSARADTALFGHTHVPFCKTVNGILLLNPGSIGRPRSSSGATFAVLECRPDAEPQVSFWSIQGGVVQKSCICSAKT